ncbi:hypothetical protein [Promicromonospora soli]|uniref:Uncharacterized protein n=1 Tax=Promicromonospora soli TaxID=2035533 RepID=A0A919G2A2_9MICO|nr:hypothetical protein [Promicromonospora soli]GHH76293.1 hypothetical protein GCM10017772_34580 [Promicromonospora soli]
MIDAAALVGRIGRDRVLEVHTHVHDVIVTLNSGVDAWDLANELGLPGVDLVEDASMNELQRTAWGHDVVPGLSYVALMGDALPGDAELYAELTGNHDAGAGLRVVGPNA